MEPFNFGGEIVWQPTSEYVERSRLRRFLDRHGIVNPAELMRRSTQDLEWFWSAVIEDLNIEFYEPYAKVIDTTAGIPWTRWCVGGKMNIVHNCLEKWVGTATQDRVAIRWEGEDGAIRLLTYGDLCREVNRLANALREIGLKKGDVVGLYMPMVPEIAVALFAVVKIGAIVLPLFSGHGADALSTRLADAEAKAILTCDGFYRRGQIVQMKSVADAAIARVTSIKHAVVLRRLGVETPWTPGRDRWWHEVMAGQGSEAVTKRTEAEDP